MNPDDMRGLIQHNRRNRKKNFFFSTRIAQEGGLEGDFDEQKREEAGKVEGVANGYFCYPFKKISIN